MATDEDEAATIWSELAGRMVSRSSPEWLHEREVDYLLWLPQLERSRVLRNYDPDKAARLAADMERLRKLRSRRGTR